LRAQDGGTTFDHMPVYDSAVVIGERAWIVKALTPNGNAPDAP